MSKAIDFFEDLEKREKEIYNALCTKELEGIKTFWCEFEKAWIMPDRIIGKQNKIPIRKRSFKILSNIHK